VITDISKFKFPGVYNVSFPSGGLDNSTVYYKKIEVHQRIREHDTAVISVRARDVDWFNAMGAGTPVMITYGLRDGVTSTFVGYVVQVVTRGMSGVFYERDIVCVAASRVLRTTDRTTYRGMSAPQIAESIARKVGFKFVGGDSSLRRETVTQHGETYWEFLSRLSKRIGYVFKVDQTTLILAPLPQMVNLYKSRSPYMSDSASWLSAGLVPPNIIEVSAVTGDVSEDPDHLSDTALMSSVLPNTGEVVSFYGTRGLRPKDYAALDRRTFVT
jgi:hypothetical protein